MKIKISENIRRLRKASQLTQEALAEALGVTAGAVYKWEAGLSVPDITLITELADFFEVSVDALLGYSVQNGRRRETACHIDSLARKKDYDAASKEAEHVLVKYPNDFAIVKACAEMYQHKGIERRDEKAVYRAIELYLKAIALISQNTDPEISENSLTVEIAQCHLVLGHKEKALELMKANNVCGINSDIIGFICSSSSEYTTDEALSYLNQSFGICFSKTTRCMLGYANVLARLEDDIGTLDVLRWLVTYLDSLKKSADAVAYTDKVKALVLVECAAFSLKLGKNDDAKKYLNMAYRTATAFDAAPNYGVEGMRFAIGDTKHAVAYDDMGLTAMDAVNDCIAGDGTSREVIRTMWYELCRNN